jgi:tRNA1(Val) A37 N6-methylase TrmN6
LHYRLNDNCQLVKEAFRGAIYDFQSGKGFSFNRDALLLLAECRIKPISDVLDMDLPDNKPGRSRFWNIPR